MDYLIPGSDINKCFFVHFNSRSIYLKWLLLKGSVLRSFVWNSGLRKHKISSQNYLPLPQYILNCGCFKRFKDRDSEFLEENCPIFQSSLVILTAISKYGPSFPPKFAPHKSAYHSLRITLSCMLCERCCSDSSWLQYLIMGRKYCSEKTIMGPELLRAPHSRARHKKILSLKKNMTLWYILYSKNEHKCFYTFTLRCSFHRSDWRLDGK